MIEKMKIEVLVNPIPKIRKRDGTVVDFDWRRIYNAIHNACRAVGKDGEIAMEATKRVLEKVEKRFKHRTPDVEDMQDMVEETLIEMNQADIVKAYIIYRQKRKEIREEKMRILNKTKLDRLEKEMSLNALKVLASRYLKKNEKGEVIESPREMFERVALTILISDILHDERVYDKSGNQERKESMEIGDMPELRIVVEFNEFHKETLKRTFEVLNEEGKMKRNLAEIVEMIATGEFSDYEKTFMEYFNVMAERKFLPNTPALANFGKTLSMGSACFVLDINDSMESIMETLKNAAMIFKSGGGCGYNFSKLRPEGDIVKSTHGVASGPVSFMKLYDAMTDVIKQGGIRRGANMGILNSDHPDVEKFIKAKEGNKALRNFNISVLIKSDFWKYYESGEEYPLINPRDGKVWRKVDPRALMKMIAYQAWESAEPGVLFEDNINRYNPLLKELGPIVTTNPCGEVLLYPNESCNLGSINLMKFVKERDGKKFFDFDALKDTVKTAVRFLDNIIDVNKFPLDAIRDMTRKTRKIGLGVMGLADALFALGIRYDSEKGLEFMADVMEFINYHSKLASIELSRERGPFPLFEKSSYAEGKLPFPGKNGKLDWDRIREMAKEGIRNAYTTVIAPTGSISMIADTSSGIEPAFALVYEKHVAVGRFFYVDPVFEEFLRENGMYSEDIIEKISNNAGSIQSLDFPQEVKEIFRVANDIGVEWHIRAQATFQNWVDSSISKTINMPETATPDDVEKAYLMAHELGCKGLTVYREGSIKNQVINKKKKCPQCGAELVYSEGCMVCPSCGYGKCS